MKTALDILFIRGGSCQRTKETFCDMLSIAITYIVIYRDLSLFLQLLIMSLKENCAIICTSKIKLSVRSSHYTDFYYSNNDRQAD